MMPPCIVLAGGRGTRLAGEVPDLPKCLAPVAGRPFLHWQLRRLHSEGVHDVVLSLGHMADAVLQADLGRDLPGLRLRHVVEAQPLGTGGAVRLAMQQLGLPQALVANGDTLLSGALRPMAPALADAELLRMAAVQVNDRTRFGGLQLGAHGQVLAFTEKGQPGVGPINAGLYRLRHRAFDLLPERDVFSLETDLMPLLLARGGLFACALGGEFIDIGVPQDYRRLAQMRQLLGA